MQRVEEVVGDRHAGDLVQGLLLASLGLEPQLPGEAPDERSEQHDDRCEDPGPQRLLRDAGERVGERDGGCGERGGGQSLPVPPAVRGQDHDGQRGEDERAGPVAGQRDHEDREGEVQEEQRFRLPGRGLEPERPEGAEDRVGQQHRDRAEEDRAAAPGRRG